MLSAVTTASIALSIFPSPIPVEQSPPPPGHVSYQFVSVGSGCKSGTSTAINPDNTGFKTSYPDTFVAKAGAATVPADWRKSCTLAVTVHAPGYSFAIDQAEHEGFANLKRGASAVVRTSYRFQGGMSTAIEHPFHGPLDDRWQAVDVAPTEFSSCEQTRALIIAPDLRVSAGTSDPASTSHITLESTAFRLAWKRCP